MMIRIWAVYAALATALIWVTTHNPWPTVATCVITLSLGAWAHQDRALVTVPATLAYGSILATFTTWPVEGPRLAGYTRAGTYAVGRTALELLVPFAGVVAAALILITAPTLARWVGNLRVLAGHTYEPGDRTLAGWATLVGAALTATTLLTAPRYGLAVAAGSTLMVGLLHAFRRRYPITPTHTPDLAAAAPTAATAPTGPVWVTPGPGWDRDLRAELDSDGWLAFRALNEVEVVAECPDPGNPGRTLTLYRVPATYGPWRALEVRDGSPDEGGALMDALAVPAATSDPVDALAAAATTYGIHPDVYRRTQHRT